MSSHDFGHELLAPVATDDRAFPLDTSTGPVLSTNGAGFQAEELVRKTLDVVNGFFETWCLH